MNDECTRNIEQAETEVTELEAQLNSRDEFKRHIETIRRVLKEAERDAQNGVINKDFVKKYIDKIFVTPKSDEMKLEVKIFTGESSEKYLSKLKARSAKSTAALTGRSGHIFKKMIQSYENNLK
jgi:hypothetical protein